MRNMVTAMATAPTIPMTAAIICTVLNAGVCSVCVANVEPPEADLLTRWLPFAVTLTKKQKNDLVDDFYLFNFLFKSLPIDMIKVILYWSNHWFHG